MDLSHAITAAVALLAGIVGALTVIAPLTRNTIDDKVRDAGKLVLEIAEKLKSQP